MMKKLFATFKYSTVMVITLLNIKVTQANSQEYVFTAPPEVDNNIVEIPAKETDYPFYECESESEEQKTEEEELIDSHNCDCKDCEDMVEDTEENEKFTSRNKPKKN